VLAGGLEDAGNLGHIAVVSQSPAEDPDEPVGVSLGCAESDSKAPETKKAE
jgi:hypothetical protein